MRLAEAAVLHSAALLRKKNHWSTQKMLLSSSLEPDDMHSLSPIRVKLAEIHDAAATLIIFCQTSVSDNPLIIDSIRYVKVQKF